MLLQCFSVLVWAWCVTGDPLIYGNYYFRKNNSMKWRLFCYLIFCCIILSFKIERGNFCVHLNDIGSLPCYHPIYTKRKTKDQSGSEKQTLMPTTICRKSDRNFFGSPDVAIFGVGREAYSLWLFLQDDGFHKLGKNLVSSGFTEMKVRDKVLMLSWVQNQTFKV